MAPLSSEEREEVLQEQGATLELLDEFELLVSQFFMFDPDMISAEEELARHGRIETLAKILFPGRPLQLSPVR